MAKGRNQDETIIKIANEADDFGALFRTYLVQRTENLLAEVSKDDTLLEEEVRSKALAALEFALESSEMQSLAGGLLLAMAPKMERAGFREEWMTYLEKGIESCKNVKDVKTEAELLYQIGFLCQLRAKYEESKNYLERSISLFTDLALPQRQAQALFRLAFVNRLQRDYKSAQYHIARGFAVTDKSDPACAYGYYLRGLLAYDDNDYETAIAEYQHSLRLYQQLGDKQMIAQRLGNIGSAYSEWRKFPEAISYYNQSIEMFEAQQDMTRAAVMKMNVGNVYLLCNEPQTALNFYEVAEPVFRKTGEELHLALVHLNYGIGYRLLRDWHKSEQYLLNAIEHWKLMGDTQALVNTIDELAILYKVQGNIIKSELCLNEALNDLEQIKQQPGYNTLYMRVRKHLAELHQDGAAPQL